MATTDKDSTPLKVGMIGGGTVGGGVYELLMTNNNKSQSHNTSVVITKLCVRDASKERDFVMDTSRTTLTTNVQDVLEDDDIDMVIEVMGGTGLAKTIVETSLKSNKHVVTANKALVAAELDALQELCLSSSSSSPVLAYEAAVCGAIPIINILQTCYTGDSISQVMGICNGTTNYMLGKMFEEGMDYDVVLKEAQDLGYAEADPTADVEGHDVRAKIAILAKLAFGTTVPSEQIPCRGISQLSTVDFDYARLLGCTIKLIGTAKRFTTSSKKEKEEGDDEAPSSLSVFVTPQMVDTKHPLASLRGSGNGVAVTSRNLGTALYTGPGAGRFPTANSIVADVLRIASSGGGGGVRPPFPLQSSLPIETNYAARFYIRIPFQDGLGIIKTVGALAEEYGVSIHSILQNPIVDPKAADFCLTTEECCLEQVEQLCKAIEEHDFCRMACVYMPLLLMVEE